MCKAIPPLRFLRFAFAGATLAGILLGLLMAVSPEFHDFVHHDGDAAEHQCLVTTMQYGGCDDLAPEASAVSFLLPTMLRLETTDESLWVRSLFATGCVFEHGPPLVS